MRSGNRRDFLLRKVASSLLNQLLFVSECEVHKIPLRREAGIVAESTHESRWARHPKIVTLV
jgi:hypothetical protein